MNVILLSGNLGNDPEVRYLPSGQPVANFSLATTERWKDKSTGEKEEDTDWHQITAWGRLAEICGEYLSKGSRVNIVGRVKYEKWEGRDGNTRWATKIIASRMEMVGPRIREDGGSKTPPDDDIPF